LEDNENGAFGQDKYQNIKKSLLEIAKTNFRFERSQQVVRISIQSEILKKTD
jgi:hypothetical protein